jgi:hypothetical protein
VGGLSPQHRVWPEMSSLPVRNGKGHCRATRASGNALQKSSDDLNVDSTIDCLPSRHKFFINHTLFVKKCDQRGSGLGFLQTKLFGPW